MRVLVDVISIPLNKPSLRIESSYVRELCSSFCQLPERKRIIYYEAYTVTTSAFFVLFVALGRTYCKNLTADVLRMYFSVQKSLSSEITAEYMRVQYVVAHILKTELMCRVFF